MNPENSQVGEEKMFLSASEARLVRGWIARASVAPVLAAALCAQAAASPTIVANLDYDSAPERFVQLRVRLPYFPAPVFGATWAVSDRVAGKAVTVNLGPPGERLGRPRIANRNGDRLRDVYIEAQAGNSLSSSGRSGSGMGAERIVCSR